MSTVYAAGQSLPPFLKSHEATPSLEALTEGISPIKSSPLARRYVVLPSKPSLFEGESPISPLKSLTKGISPIKAKKQVVIHLKKAPSK